MADTNPTTVILADLIRRHTKAPFEAFKIVTSSGRAYAVPSADHMTVTRLLREVIVEDDKGSSTSVNPLHISSIEALRKTAA